MVDKEHYGSRSRSRTRRGTNDAKGADAEQIAETRGQEREKSSARGCSHLREYDDAGVRGFDYEEAVLVLLLQRLQLFELRRQKVVDSGHGAPVGARQLRKREPV